jgi:amino acid adenylation domain-containing protein
MLGILKAGGAYVPIDPSYPGERIDYLLADCGAPIVVAATATHETMSRRHPAMVWLDGGGIEVSPNVDGCLRRGRRCSTDITDRNLAYIIYTSGSTGDPKGVCVEHRNVVRLFEQTERWFHFDTRDVWSLFHSISFDFSVWEIWGALIYGGRLVLLPDNVSRSPELLISLLRSERVTILNQTPSAFQQMLNVAFLAKNREISTRDLALRQIIFGGERLDPRMLAPWIKRHGDQMPSLTNMYGITEITVHCTYRPITASDLDKNGASPIGVPLPDLRFYVLDGDGNVAPDGVPGEMCIAGAGLARGYLNRAELTARRFITATETVGEERLYLSGDRGVRSPGGELKYLSRVDDQMKIRGYRIEPGEVETCIERLDSVARAFVARRDFGDGDIRLVAYLLPANTSCLDREAITVLVAKAERHVRYFLPRHLRPSVFKVVTEIPITQHGKVDRDALGKQ